MTTPPKKNIPRPCPEQVKIYLEKWEKLDAYPEQEKALDKLFLELCPKNEKIKDILLKCATLNNFYSTNIFSVFPVAKHILELDIDGRLTKEDISLVDELQTVNIRGEIHKFYSFASKYCSHHKPEVFPIYDSYVDRVLRHFRKENKFCTFKNEELKNYREFIRILNRFKNYYGLTKFNLKDIDRYLWLLGKKYYPKNNPKEKTEEA